MEIGIPSRPETRLIRSSGQAERLTASGTDKIKNFTTVITPIPFPEYPYIGVLKSPSRQAALSISGMLISMPEQHLWIDL